MTTILIIIGIAVLLWVGIVLAGRNRKRSWFPVGMTIAIGLSLYFVTGMPQYPDHPVQRSLRGSDFGSVIEDPRKGMIDRFSSVNSWLVTSDGLIRTGDTQSATLLLQQGIRRNPDSLDLWLAFANALVAHGGGVMTPAAAMAYDKAARLNPAHPGPPFFAGLALAQSGDYAGARALWTRLMEHTPADAPWREDLEKRLADLPAPESQAAQNAATRPGATPSAPTESATPTAPTSR